MGTAVLQHLRMQIQAAVSCFTECQVNSLSWGGPEQQLSPWALWHRSRGLQGSCFVLGGASSSLPVLLMRLGASPCYGRCFHTDRGNYRTQPITRVFQSVEHWLLWDIISSEHRMQGSGSLLMPVLCCCTK